jgi:hypothetical protein
MLKDKSKQVLDIIASNPKINNTDAYLAVHKTDNRVSAATNAYKLLQKPEAQIYLEKHIQRAKNRVVQLVDSEKEEIALRAADSLLDRALGKATQRVEQTTTGVTLTIDLTSALNGTE